MLCVKHLIFISQIESIVKQNINKSVFINLNKKITPAYKIKGCIIKTVQLQWERRKKKEVVKFLI